MPTRIALLIALAATLGCADGGDAAYDTDDFDDPFVDIDPADCLTEEASKAEVYVESTEWIRLGSHQPIHVAASCRTSGDVGVGGSCEFVELDGDRVGCDGLALKAAYFEDNDADSLDDPATFHCRFAVGEVGICLVRAAVNCLDT